MSLRIWSDALGAVLLKNDNGSIELSADEQKAVLCFLFPSRPAARSALERTERDERFRTMWLGGVSPQIIRHELQIASSSSMHGIRRRLGLPGRADGEKLEHGLRLANRGHAIVAAKRAANA